MSEQTNPAAGPADLSEQLAQAVERAGASVVRVEARRRIGASGVAWSADGLILTADHVLEQDEDLAVGLPDGRRVAATIVGRDPGSDLALLRAEAAGLTPIERGATPRVGHLALIVARPGQSVETSIGVVNAVEGPFRSRRGGRFDGVIRTDARFYPGFSGGALASTDALMIGLATSRFGAGTGAGLGIPLATVDRVAASLLSHGRVRQGYLGVTSQRVPLPEALRTSLALDQETGLMILGVESGGPAAQGGVLMGDVLLALGDQPIRHTEDLRAALGGERIGQQTPARVCRGGELRDLVVTIGERT